MPLALAYLAVVFIWSTTPLGVKLSTDTLPFAAAALARMALATLLCVMLARVLRVRIPWRGGAVRSYAASSLGTFGGMSLTFAAIEYIPSGLVSVIFGLAPVFSGVAAHLLLGERSLTPLRVVALLLALTGLAIVFQGTLRWQPDALPGFLLAVAAVLLFALGGVLVKRYAGELDAVQHTTGSLLFSLPLFVMSWWILGADVPAAVSSTSVYAVVYLAAIGSVVAFLLYFRLLRQLGPTQVALIPLITPPLAVALGAIVVGEPVTPETVFGGLLILVSLALYQFHQRLPWPRAVPLAPEGPLLKR